MKSTLIALTLCIGLTACGGGLEDDSSSSSSGTASDASTLSGIWTSSSLGASWRFNSDGSGQLRQRSTDGGSCQITDIEFKVSSSSKVITYYGTRYRMTGNTPYNYDETVRKGPFTAAYQISGNSVTIGNGTYSKSSSAAC